MDHWQVWVVNLCERVCLAVHCGSHANMVGRLGTHRNEKLFSMATRLASNGPFHGLAYAFFFWEPMRIILQLLTFLEAREGVTVFCNFKSLWQGTGAVKWTWNMWRSVNIEHGRVYMYIIERRHGPLRTYRQESDVDKFACYSF